MSDAGRFRSSAPDSPGHEPSYPTANIGSVKYGVLTAPRVAFWVTLLLGLVAAVSVPVGYAAAPAHETFNWEVASIFGTALGTTTLAGFTGALAFTTSGDVRATWELAQLTRADQEARERPVVLLHHAEWQQRREDPVPGQDEPSQSGVVVVQLRNVGLGPALRVVIESRYSEDEHQAKITPGLIPVIMPGEMGQFELPVYFPRKPPEIDLGGFKINGTYLDRSQRREYDIISDWESSPTMAWNDPWEGGERAPDT